MSAAKGWRRDSEPCLVNEVIWKLPVKAWSFQWDGLPLGGKGFEHELLRMHLQQAYIESLTVAMCAMLIPRTWTKPSRKSVQASHASKWWMHWQRQKNEELKWKELWKLPSSATATSANLWRLSCHRLLEDKFLMLSALFTGPRNGSKLHESHSRNPGHAIWSEEDVAWAARHVEPQPQGPGTSAKGISSLSAMLSCWAQGALAEWIRLCFAGRQLRPIVAVRWRKLLDFLERTPWCLKDFIRGICGIRCHIRGIRCHWWLLPFQLSSHFKWLHSTTPCDQRAGWTSGRGADWSLPRCVVEM